MFRYKGCKAERAAAYGGGTTWMITFEDGTHDMTHSLKFAIMLCDKRIRRASL